MRDPVRLEARHDLALRLELVQKFIIIHIALRDALIFPIRRARGGICVRACVRACVCMRLRDE